MLLWAILLLSVRRFISPTGCGPILRESRRASTPSGFLPAIPVGATLLESRSIAPTAEHLLTWVTTVTGQKT